MATAKVPTVQIEVPVVPSDKYAQRTVYLRLDTEQSQTLRAVFEGLECAGEVLNDGTPVTSTQKALKWVLEQLDPC